MNDNKIFEVIIIGGSYAGLAAAMSLGRSLRSVLVIDSGLPCNRQTPFSHNFLTQDGSTPQQVTEKAMAQVAAYDTVVFHAGRADQVESSISGFTVTTQAGAQFAGKKLIFATGMRDIMPQTPGFTACWGTTIIHCPYCHGYEFRGKTTGVMINDEKNAHLISLISNLTSDLTVLTNGTANFNAQTRAKLAKHNIVLKESEIKTYTHSGAEIKEVLFTDGSQLHFDVLYATLPVEQHSNIPQDMGCDLNEHGYLKVNNLQQTNLPGVYACGDNTGMMRSIANSVAQGSLTGALVNKELVDEEF